MSELLSVENAIDPPYEDEDVTGVMLTYMTDWIWIKQGSYKPALMRTYDAGGNVEYRVIVVCEDLSSTDQLTFESQHVKGIKFSKEKKSAIPNVTEDNRMLP